MRCTPGYGSELSAQPILSRMSGLVRQAKDTRSKDEHGWEQMSLLPKTAAQSAYRLPKVTARPWLKDFPAAMLLIAAGR